MSTYQTLALSEDWDLTLDGQGFIGIASGGQAVAQDAASACLTFYGEAYYDSSLGIPWDTQVLGKPASLGYVSSKMKTEAKKLSVVDDAECTLYLNKTTRKVGGQLLVTYDEDQTVQVNL